LEKGDKMRVAIGILPLKETPGVELFLHPVRYKNTITFEPMAEEAVIALITQAVVEDNPDLPAEVREYFEELDDGYLSSESNFDQFDLEALNLTHLVVGRDIHLHPRLENIKRFLGILRDFGGVEIEGIELPNYLTPSDPELGELVETERSYEYALEEVAELESFDGGVVYCCSDSGVVKKGELLCSTQFVIANRIKGFQVKIGDEIFHIKKVPDLKGTFGIIYRKVNSYPFVRVKVENWEGENGKK